MPAIRIAVPVLEYLGHAKIGIAESGLRTRLDAVADAVRPGVIAANVHATRSSALGRKKHTVIVRRPICFTPADASEVRALRPVLQHQWPSIIRIAGRRTCGAGVDGILNRL